MPPLKRSVAVHEALRNLRVVGKAEGTASVGQKIIATHNGRFHCDDALAVGLLRTLPEYNEALIVRTRDPAEIEKADVVVDVGGVYDPSSLRFDHHQKGFSTTYDDVFTVSKMSSAGMVFKHFGQRILTERFSIPSGYAAVIGHKLYENLIHSIDAIDNGVDISETPARFLIRTDLSSRISRLNCDWNNWVDDVVSADDFAIAVAMAMDEFDQHVAHYRDSWLAALVVVREAFETRKTAHSSGRVIKLKVGCPFEDHIYDLEKEFGTDADSASQILFAVYPNDSTGSSWRVKTVKKCKGSFENRLSLPEELRGLRDAELTAKGFDGITFIHHAGFLAGAKSEAACERLVEAALDCLH